MKTQLQSLLAVALVAAAVCAPAQSFLDMADASLDALREEREQNAAPANVRAIFAKAKAAADEDDKLNLCGFYTGMSEADAQTLVGHYALKDGEWSTEGDPVYKIHLSLKGVRRVTKGGNTFDELAQAVANRVGSLKQDWETKVYSLKTIDGISVTMSDSSGFTMVDAEAKSAAERKAREEREAAERKAREKREAAERKAREKREAAERKAREERKAAERKAKEEAQRAALTWKGESKSIPISDSVSIHLRSVPGNLWFGQYEVTQAQWEAVMGDNPSNFKNPDNPVERVSWVDCQEFLKKLNALPSVKNKGLTFRLPTDAEWEAACWAGATGDYCRLADGTEITKDTIGRVAWFSDNAGKQTHPVGQKQPNAFGLYDMHGNVWEWTSTAVGGYHCGGGWDDSARDCESSYRDWSSLSDRFNSLGFRLCAETAEAGVEVKTAEAAEKERLVGVEAEEIARVQEVARSHQPLIDAFDYAGYQDKMHRMEKELTSPAALEELNWAIRRAECLKEYRQFLIADTKRYGDVRKAYRGRDVRGVSADGKRLLVNQQQDVRIADLALRDWISLSWGVLENRAPDRPALDNIVKGTQLFNAAVFYYMHGKGDFNSMQRAKKLALQALELRGALRSDAGRLIPPLAEEFGDAPAAGGAEAPASGGSGDFGFDE